MGSHTQYGGYIVDLNLVRTFVVPDLTDFKVCRYPFPLLRTERLNTIIAKKKLESYIYVEMINAMDIILTFLPPFSAVDTIRDEKRSRDVRCWNVSRIRTWTQGCAVLPGRVEK